MIYLTLAAIWIAGAALVLLFFAGAAILDERERQANERAQALQRQYEAGERVIVEPVEA